MPVQYMDPQDESEYYSSYAQQKLHPRPRRQLPSAKTIVGGFFILLCTVLVASAFIGTITPQHSLISSVAGWFFLLIFFSLGIWAFAKSLIFDYHWPRREQ